MVVKNIEIHPPDEIPEADEGWWASVLADEDKHEPGLKEPQVVHTSEMNNSESVNWEFARKVYEQDEIISLQVYGCNRGGLLVSGDGIQGFVPASHLVDMPGELEEEKRRNNLTSYIGKSLSLKVIECESSQERIVLSERAALAGEGKRKLLFQTLKTGGLIEGCVTNVTDFGVFVDLGGVEGLIHVSELSWGRVQHPADVLKIGQCIRALVLQVSEESARVALSLKRLQQNPWEVILQRYQPGDVVPARITTIMRFGAFARLDEGVEGLIHVSSIRLPPNQKHIDEFLSPGQLVFVEILHIDGERRRLGLGLVNSG
jgi:small subunit ribosomal protein S1